MDIKVIYYTDVAQIKELVNSYNKADYSIVADVDTSYGTESLISIESDEYEDTFRELFQRMDRTSALVERAIIFEYLFTHYPRIRRYIDTFRLYRKNRVVCFMAEQNMNIFDLAFRYGGNRVSYYRIDGGALKEVDLEGYVVFYSKDEYSQCGNIKPFWDNLPCNDGVGGVRRRAVLFVAHDNEYNLYLKPFYPVFETLKGRGVPFKVLACDARAAKFLSEYGVEFERFEPQDIHVTYDDVASCMAFYKEQADGLFEYLFNLAFNSAHLNSIIKAIKNFSTIELGSYTDVFYVPDGTPSALYIDHFASLLNLSTHTIISAGVSKYYRTLPYYLANTIYCYGMDCKEGIESVFRNKHIVLSGNPTLYMYNRSKECVNEKGLPVILVATSAYDERELECMEYMLKKIKPEEALVVLKPHPYYKDRYECLKDKLNGHRMLSAYEPIEGYIARASVVVTDHSQVGKDAHLLGKPVISVTLTNEPLYLKGIDSIIYCNSCQSLVQEIYNILSGKRKITVDKDFIDAYNYGNKAEHYRVVVDHLLEGCGGCRIGYE